MAKRTTSVRNTGTSKNKKASEAAAGSGEHPVAGVEQTTKAVEQTTSERARKEDVRSSMDMAAVTQEMIAQRAYEIWRSEGGDALENWKRAERELQAQDTQQGNWR